MLKGLFLPFIAPILAVAGKDWRRMGAQCLMLVALGRGWGLGGGAEGGTGPPLSSCNASDIQEARWGKGGSIISVRGKGQGL